MKTIDVKRLELIRFVMQANDESILDKVKTFFTSSTKEQADWWGELDSDDKTEIELSLKELDHKKTTPHATVKSRIKSLIDARKTYSTALLIKKLCFNL